MNQPLSLLTSFESLTHASSYISAVATFAETVGSNYVKDQSIRNALIDTAIAYLQSIKTSEPTT